MRGDSLEKIRHNKERVNNQMALVKEYIQAKHYAGITIAVNCIALIALASLLGLGFDTALGITILLLLSLTILWDEITTYNRAQQKSEEKIFQIMEEMSPGSKKKLEEKIGIVPWYKKFFLETAGVIFSAVLIYFVILLLIKIWS